MVYVTPFSGAVEAAAEAFRAALEHPDDETPAVLEHHGTFDETRVSQREAWPKLQLAAESWNAPVVVTTAVQLFESLFSRRPLALPQAAQADRLGDRPGPSPRLCRSTT